MTVRNETLRLMLAGVSLLLTMMLINPVSFGRDSELHVRHAKAVHLREKPAPAKVAEYQVRK